MVCITWIWASLLGFPNGLSSSKQMNFYFLQNQTESSFLATIKKRQACQLTVSLGEWCSPIVPQALCPNVLKSRVKGRWAGQVGKGSPCFLSSPTCHPNAADTCQVEGVLDAWKRGLWGMKKTGEAQGSKLENNFKTHLSFEMGFYDFSKLGLGDLQLQLWP